MNFVFVSPQFPKTYWNFCDRLKHNGVNVLGIGDSGYDEIPDELKECLTEYYRVDNMENYDEMLRAMGFFTFKYGRIDWVESNNEYWLGQDARLRTDFNITTGIKSAEIEKFKRKSMMKTYYQKAGIPTARWCVTADVTEAQAFAKTVGWPVIAKPDNGVGANGTHKFKNKTELNKFFQQEGPNAANYILEEFVDGVGDQTADAEHGLERVRARTQMRHGTQILHRMAFGLDGIIRRGRAFDKDLAGLQFKRLLRVRRQDERTGDNHGCADVQLGNFGEICKFGAVDDLHLREKCAVGQVDEAEVLTGTQIAHPAADLDLFAGISVSLFKKGTDRNKLFHSDRSSLVFIMLCNLQKQNTCVAAGIRCSLVPDARLHLANMAGADHKHAQTALADAAAHGQRQFPA